MKKIDFFSCIDEIFSYYSFKQQYCIEELGVETARARMPCNISNVRYYKYGDTSQNKGNNIAYSGSMSKFR